MIRRSTPIGWPRRDPRHYRFAIPNAVWEHHLKPAEFAIFSYLCYHRSTDTLTPEMIAEGVHLSVSTTKKYLKALVDRGLVTAEWSLALNNQYITSEKFFTLPNELFLLKLSPSAFMIYAYLLLIEDRRTHTCHPSYNTIAAATDLAKNTVMKGISTLSELNLITVEASSYFDKRGMKWKGNNLYTILPVRAAVDTFHQRQLRQLELDVERLLFKLAVEQDMVMNVLAAGMEIPDEQLKTLRGRCIQDVKKTSGSISLDDAVRYQRGGL